MDDKFMFVPTSYKDQREKELIYAACKAHISRRAGEKRRPQKAGREKSALKPIHDSALQIRSSPSAATSRLFVEDFMVRQQTPVTILPTCLLSFVHDTGSDGMLHDRVPPELLHAISFTRFHLARSWSPTFMVLLVSGSMDGATFEQAQAKKATQWMWQLWTSNAVLFWSVVASIMPTMIPYLPAARRGDTQKMALELKEQSFHGLRHMLHKNSTDSAGSLLVTAYQVKSLFREACASGDTDAASYHCRMLAQLAGKLIESSPTIESHRIALWGDALPALLQFRRPVVDFKVELSKTVQTIWAAAEPVLPDMRVVNFELPDCVLDDTIREAFLHLKIAVYILNVSMVASPDQHFMRVELLFQWLTTKAEHYICRLLDLYFDLVECADTLESLKTLTEGERRVQAALALALLFAYQKSFFDICHRDDIDINESAQVLLPEMRKTLQYVQIRCSKSEQLFYQDAIFWIIIMGVWAERCLNMAERTNRTALKPFDSANHWLQSQLSSYAGNSRLNSWSKARKVLNTFVWSDHWDLDAARWYSNIARLGRRSKTARAAT